MEAFLCFLKGYSEEFIVVHIRVVQDAIDVITMEPQVTRFSVETD